MRVHLSARRPEHREHVGRRAADEGHRAELGTQVDAGVHRVEVAQRERIVADQRRDLDQPIAIRFLAYLKEFLEFTVPAYISEGKTRLTIAIGCTGGYHRSIVIAEEVATWLRGQDFGPVSVFHRELDRT
jgi:hypothetical protein